MLMAGRDYTRSELCCYGQSLHEVAKAQLLLCKLGLRQQTHEVKHG